MKKKTIVFVAFEECDHLGVGYMASLLSQNGFETRVIDFRYKKEEILRQIKEINPLVIGFSIIFQYHIYSFKDLITYLREEGVTCHFTAGGQYASLKYQDLYNLIPDLDSMVRFEGEYTMVELANCLTTGTDWRNIEGLAFRDDGKIKANKLREVEMDLDKFPFPQRLELSEYALNKKYATIIAGRGCVNSCSFCNLRQFNKKSGGPYKRIRRPEEVVREMEYLFHEKGCSVFLFQDDDFPVKTNKETKWIERFCSALKSTGLNDKVLWKINCRPDEVEENTFIMMRENGLYLVFLGIDDGTDIGLKILNKKMSVAKSLEGINILKKLDIGFDYGFMLFQPTTTFTSLAENIDFLKLICGDGYTPVNYLKLMPYYETVVEKELVKSGKIKGVPGFLNYEFIEDSMNHYYEFTDQLFLEWLKMPEGFVNLTRWARNFFSVYPRYFRTSPDFLLLNGNLRMIIANGNLFLLETMKELAQIFKEQNTGAGKNDINERYQELIGIKHKELVNKVNYTMEELLRMASRQLVLSSH
jgi:anaerobic magnesium-protoporphyrin IX monomethyl ester cyclase